MKKAFCPPLLTDIIYLATYISTHLSCTITIIFLFWGVRCSDSAQKKIPPQLPKPILSMTSCSTRELPNVRQAMADKSSDFSIITCLFLPLPLPLILHLFSLLYTVPPFPSMTGVVYFFSRNPQHYSDIHPHFDKWGRVFPLDDGNMKMINSLTIQQHPEALAWQNHCMFKQRSNAWPL